MWLFRKSRLLKWVAKQGCDEFSHGLSWPGPSIFHSKPSFPPFSSFAAKIKCNNIELRPNDVKLLFKAISMSRARTGVERFNSTKRPLIPVPILTDQRPRPSPFQLQSLSVFDHLCNTRPKSNQVAGDETFMRDTKRPISWTIDTITFVRLQPSLVLTRSLKE